MKQVQALRTFVHGERRDRNSRFSVPARTAAELERARLVRVLDDGPTPENPSTAGGEKSSASPAVQASPQTTAKRSGVGVKKARKKSVKKARAE